MILERFRVRAKLSKGKILTEKLGFKALYLYQKEAQFEHILKDVPCLKLQLAGKEIEIIKEIGVKKRMRSFIFAPTPEDWADKIRKMITNNLLRMQEQDCMR